MMVPFRARLVEVGKKQVVIECCECGGRSPEGSMAASLVAHLDSCAALREGFYHAEGPQEKDVEVNKRGQATRRRTRKPGPGDAAVA